MSTKLTYTGAEVQELLDKIEKGDFDNAKTLEGHPASYFAIASEFTSLAESFATEQGRINTLYSYFNNGSANDALSLGGQLPSYYATALQYEILQQTLTDFKSLFDSMFEKDSENNIHAKLSLWSSGGITAGGAGSGGSGSGGGILYNRLDSWADYSADKAGYVLSAALGKDLDNRVSALANAGYITASALAPYALRSEIPSLVGYATQSWVGENYLSKSGGTLSGSNRDLLSLNTSNTSGPIITLYENGNLIALIGCVPKQTTTDYGAYFVNVSSKFGVILGNDKKAYITLNTDTMSKDYQILHSGNYSDYALSVYGGTVNGSITASSFIGNLTGKADSATKLATPRTIWGQSFDGAGNVNGDLFLPNNKAIYAFASDNSTAFHVASLGSDDIMRYGYASKVSHIRGNSVHLLYGSSHTTGFVLNSSGNVGIGGATADEKLHVYGNGKFSGALTANSLTIGGVTITYDSANEALCINGNMYALGGVTAGGVGSGGSGGGGASYDRLDSWSDYSADKSGWVLSALLGKDLDNRVSALANAGYITASYLAPYALRSEIPSLVGYATEAWVASQGYITQSALSPYFLISSFTKANIKSTLGISDWALAATKPTYTASEVGALSVNGGTVKGSITANSFIGNLTGKADSATKLATPRTIWGQSFDGAGDVNGDLFLPNNKAIYAFASDNSNASHVASLGSDDIMRYGYASKVSHIRGNSVHLLYGSSHTTGFVLNSSGNVGIGGATADEKLHVYGNGKFTGALTVSSLTIGGVTLTYDSGNEALCINGNMYALGGVTAGGAGISAYSSLEARVARIEQQLNIS